ncbi:hypothetical protein ACLI1A_13990 [Flavobacterium sp. RHBU_3]|uniref:hypothetical protein n=1 Tax=Flavobacterium sp. RHBU_3 TaxID=3391184 RepID=UPI003984A4F7
MDLAARKYHFIQELANVDESLMDKLEIVLKSYKKGYDWAYELSEEEIAEIESSIAEADKGNLIPHEEVMKIFDKWH